MKKEISKEEFCRLYGECKDKLYRYALYRLASPEDAEDAVADAALAAWQSIDKLRDPGAFTAWMFSILSACCNTGIKKIIRDREKIEKVQASGQALGELPGASNAPASLSTELSEALSILSDEERSIVLLSVVGGLSSNEISASAGITPGAVRSKLSRSLTKMREFLS